MNTSFQVFSKFIVNNKNAVITILRKEFNSTFINLNYVFIARLKGASTRKSRIDIFKCLYGRRLSFFKSFLELFKITCFLSRKYLVIAIDLREIFFPFSYDFKVFF